jgi:hypothetical protein
MSVEEIVNRLYGLPLEEFIRARNQAERELRKAGERDQADQITALRKPTATAAAVNRLVRDHRQEVEAFLAAAATLRDAQFAGKGDIAPAASVQREALEKLVGLGGESVRATLQAAAVDDNAARELLQAQQVREPEPAGFGTLLAYAAPLAQTTPASKPTAKAPARKAGAAKSQQRSAAPPKRAATADRPVESGARARLREAENVLASASDAERAARQRWKQAQRQLEKAQAAVEKAQRDLDRPQRG